MSFEAFAERICGSSNENTIKLPSHCIIKTLHQLSLRIDRDSSLLAGYEYEKISFIPNSSEVTALLNDAHLLRSALEKPLLALSGWEFEA